MRFLLRATSKDVKKTLQKCRRKMSGLVRGLQNTTSTEIRRAYLNYKRKQKGEHTYSDFLVEIFVSYGRRWTSACFYFLVLRI